MDNKCYCVHCNRIYTTSRRSCPECGGDLYWVGPSKDATDSKAEKPPLGLMPASLFYEDRANQIIEAMNRYIQAGKAIPLEWVKEYNAIVEEKSNHMVLPEYPEEEHAHGTRRAYFVG